MPIYEYVCDNCGKALERYEVYIDRQEPPACCDNPMEKQFSVSIADFRGSGFYKNDYGNGAHKLGVAEQAQRASIDCGRLGLKPAKPKPDNSSLLR
ncbi:hypothetical protein LCGC14_3062850 [marine sediment metagenome]|uniref:Putative regulatory protein FmdB zinc ribbon domain-containing protein n=1 Tax=marine sediment metagenome TaxID=412755 RepID=A0A0F8YR34_9ZZZZ